MKTLEFTTGKGRFVVVDVNDVDYDILSINGQELDKIGYLDELTEEQASEIVETHQGCMFKDYSDGAFKYYISSIDSLRSLIQSKGWYLENPFEKFADECGCEEAESRTLHNPVIFKIASDKV